MVVFRSLVFNAIFYAVLIALMIVGLPVLLGGPRAVKRYAQAWARLSLWLFSTICAVRIDVRGSSNLPPGGVIVAAKHQSFLDIVVLVARLPRFVFVMKRELIRIPVFGWYLRQSGMIPIDRAKGRAVMGELTERVRDALARGEQLIIFPEGTRRAPGDEPQYKSGVSHLYAGLDAPCVPVALNSGLFWPRRRFLRRPGRFVVEMLPPIPPGWDRAAFSAELQARIEAASNRLLDKAEADGVEPRPAAAAR